jgi:hypothetical protein
VVLLWLLLPLWLLLQLLLCLRLHLAPRRLLFSSTLSHPLSPSLTLSHPPPPTPIRLPPVDPQDGNGSIDRDELREVFHTLGCEMTENDVDQVFKELDDHSGNKGEITLAAFKQWFLASDARLRSEVRDVFTRIDTNKVSYNMVEKLSETSQ